MRKLGFIVNPIAGMGGKVGLKGTDGAAMPERARSLGAEAQAPARAARALERLSGLGERPELITGPGAMGEDLALACGWQPVPTGPIRPGPTHAGDTVAASIAMLQSQVALILFAGGDGTARDIHGVVGTARPLLGIPAGVKMQSAVFATSPENAGNVAAAFLAAPRGTAMLHAAEVMDVDETALRAGRIVPRLYGYAEVPSERRLIQGAKTRPADAGDGALDALCAEIVAEMVEERLYIIGPGRSTKWVLDHLGLAGTLLGVDAVRNRRLAGADLGERDLLGLIGTGDASIITGVIGGQGYLFGRGNQQMSAEVIRRVGPDNIIVVADAAKLVALAPPWLRVDSGDAVMDGMLCGYRRVRVAPGRSMVLEVMA